MQKIKYLNESINNIDLLILPLKEKEFLTQEEYDQYIKGKYNERSE